MRSWYCFCLAYTPLLSFFLLCNGIFGRFLPCNLEDGGNHHIRWTALMRLRDYISFDFLEVLFMLGLNKINALSKYHIVRDSGSSHIFSAWDWQWTDLSRTSGVIAGWAEQWLVTLLLVGNPEDLDGWVEAAGDNMPHPFLFVVDVHIDMYSLCTYIHNFNYNYHMLRVFKTNILTIRIQAIVFKEFSWVD